MIARILRSDSQNSVKRARRQIDVIRELRESSRPLEEVEFCLEAIQKIWEYIDGVADIDDLHGVVDLLLAVDFRAGLGLLAKDLGVDTFTSFMLGREPQ